MRARTPVSYAARLSYWNAVRGDAYELDAVDRWIADAPKRPTCSKQGMEQYAGTSVRYYGALLVAPVFRERLERFELEVVQVATEVYGRAPRRIHHHGSFSCRTSRNRSYRLSEHALGNAVDVVGFDFGPASKGEPLPEGLPKPLRWAFQVRVGRHWNAKSTAADQVHQRFLRELIGRLMDRSDVFRGFVGPGYPGHDDHFHFDVAPWRYTRLEY